MQNCCIRNEQVSRGVRFRKGHVSWGVRFRKEHVSRGVRFRKEPVSRGVRKEVIIHLYHRTLGRTECHYPMSPLPNILSVSHTFGSAQPRVLTSHLGTVIFRFKYKSPIQHGSGGDTGTLSLL